ncbi:MAG: ribosome assembly RNA-binding protein YhbY [Alcaligenaceae bacterium]|nr:ribosome assembly RNA-binding protein YhbY [Alcaligenaceae bacterium]
MSILELTSKERSALRSAAHSLKPVVQIGDNGLSDAVLKEIDRNLTAHSLIKVKVASDDRQERGTILDKICDELSCANIHHLGKTLILYRPGKSVIDTEPYDEFAPDNQRSYRKAGEAYTPKRFAAEGKKLSRPFKQAKRKNTESNRDIANAFFGRRSAKAATKTAKPTSRRRPVSALSLRAGRRKVD